MRWNWDALLGVNMILFDLFKSIQQSLRIQMLVLDDVFGYPARDANFHVLQFQDEATDIFDSSIVAL